MQMDRAVIVDVSTQIAELFANLPMLDGFSVQERATLTTDRDVAPLAGDLCLADVSVDAWAGLGLVPEVHGEIVRALRELLDEHPECYAVLRGHTFARTFH